MPKKLQPSAKFIKVLTELTKNYPSQPLSLHLSMILDGYEHFDSLSDIQLVHLIEKYSCEKEMDYQEPSDIDKIVKEAMDLDHILDEEEDEDY